jgi:hypothetical protein
MPVPRSSFVVISARFALFATTGALAAFAPACASSTRPSALPASTTVAEESPSPKRERTATSTEATATAPRRAKTASGASARDDDGDKADPGREREFPADDLRTAMRAAADGLTSCADATERRAFQAALRIETSGRVSRVDVTPRDGAVASCVRARLLELSVPPFSGDSVTIMMPVALPAR